MGRRHIERQLGTSDDGKRVSLRLDLEHGPSGECRKWLLIFKGPAYPACSTLGAGGVSQKFSKAHGCHDLGNPPAPIYVSRDVWNILSSVDPKVTLLACVEDTVDEMVNLADRAEIKITRPTKSADAHPHAILV